MYNVYNDEESIAIVPESFSEGIKIYGTIEGFVRLVWFYKNKKQRYD